MDKENLVDELDIIRGRIQDMIEDIQEKENQLASYQTKLADVKEYKRYLEAKLSWISLQS